jgi:hypothetical protein
MRDLARTLAVSIGLALLGVGSVGCGPVASLEPIYTENDLVFDPVALGVWYDEDDIYVHVTRAGDKAYRLICLTMSPKLRRGGRIAVFEAHLVKLKEHLFLDLYPASNTVELSIWYQYSLHPVHQIALVKQLRPAPVVMFMDGDYWEEHPPTIRHRRLVEDDESVSVPIVLTASTKKVQRFFRQAVKRGAFDDDEQTLKLSASKATALHFAAAQGESKEIKELLEKGVAVDARDEEGRTPLRWATDFEQPYVLAPLIEAEANVNAKDEYGNTPLYETVFRHREKMITVVEILLAEGADVTVKNKDGRTPLHIAVRRSTTVVSMLLNKGADIHTRDNDGWTPLHDAASGGVVGAVELLLAEGADVNAKDNKGRTPLDIVRADNKQMEKFLQWFRSKGAGTALDDIVRPSKKSNEETIRALKRHGAK